MSGHKPFRDLVNSPVTDPQERGVTDAMTFLIWGMKGEYSDRTEWPVAAYADEASAQAAVTRLKEAARALHSIYRTQEDALNEAGDWNGKTLLTSTEEGREFSLLHGDNAPAPGAYGFDEMEFTCSPVPLRHSTRPVDGDEQEVTKLAIAMRDSRYFENDGSDKITADVEAEVNFCELARIALAKQPSPDLPSGGSVDEVKQIIFGILAHRVLNDNLLGHIADAAKECAAALQANPLTKDKANG